MSSTRRLLSGIKISVSLGTRCVPASTWPYPPTPSLHLYLPLSYKFLIIRRNVSVFVSVSTNVCLLELLRTDYQCNALTLPNSVNCNMVITGPFIKACVSCGNTFAEDQCLLWLQAWHPTCRNRRTHSVIQRLSEAEVEGIQVILRRPLWRLILSPHVPSLDS